MGISLATLGKCSVSHKRMLHVIYVHSGLHVDSELIGPLSEALGATGWGPSAPMT